MQNDNPVATPLNQLLRRIPRDATAEITLKSGWVYHTNIGELVNRAAEEIEQQSNRVADFVEFTFENNWVVQDVLDAIRSGEYVNILKRQEEDNANNTMD